MPFQVGQIQAKLRCTVKVNGSAVDLTGYNEVYLDVLKPAATSATTYTRTAGELTYETDGTDGKINRITTASTEFSVKGKYTAQVRLTTAGGEDFKTAIALFEVNDNL